MYLCAAVDLDFLTEINLILTLPNALENQWG